MAESAPPTQQRFGDYTVYYNAIRADALPADQLRKYRLSPDPHTLLLNVAVRAGGKNVPARVEARMTNLAEQVRAIAMREDQSNGMIAYLGVAHLDDPDEVLTFDLEILPRLAEQPLRLQFRQSFDSMPGPSTEAAKRGIDSLVPPKDRRGPQRETEEVTRPAR